MLHTHTKDALTSLQLIVFFSIAFFTWVRSITYTKKKFTEIELRSLCCLVFAKISLWLPLLKFFIVKFLKQKKVCMCAFFMNHHTRITIANAYESYGMHHKFWIPKAYELCNSMWFIDHESYYLIFRCVLNVRIALFLNCSRLVLFLQKNKNKNTKMENNFCKVFSFKFHKELSHLINFRLILKWRKFRLKNVCIKVLFTESLYKFELLDRRPRQRGSNRICLAIRTLERSWLTLWFIHFD